MSTQQFINGPGRDPFIAHVRGVLSGPGPEEDRLRRAARLIWDATADDDAAVQEKAESGPGDAPPKSSRASRWDDPTVCVQRLLSPSSLETMEHFRAYARALEHARQAAARSISLEGEYDEALHPRLPNGEWCDKA